MSAAENVQLVQRMFAAFSDLSTPLSTMEEFLTDDFYQLVDGKRSDKAGFLDHAVALRGAISALRFEFLQIFATENRAATVHFAHVVRKNGAENRIKVVAVYGLRDGKLCFVDELTHAEDADARELGSVRSA